MKEDITNFDPRNENSIKELTSQLKVGEITKIELAAVLGDVWIWHITLENGKEYAVKLYPFQNDNLEREIATWKEMQFSPLVYPKFILAGCQGSTAYIYLEWMGEPSVSLMLQHPDSAIEEVFLQNDLGTVSSIESLEPRPWNLHITTDEGNHYLLKVFPLHQNPSLGENAELLEKMNFNKTHLLKKGIYIQFYYVILDWLEDKKAINQIVKQLDQWASKKVDESFPSYPVTLTPTIAVLFLTDENHNFKGLIPVEGVPLITKCVQAYKKCCEAVLIIASDKEDPVALLGQEAGAKIVIATEKQKKTISPIEVAMEYIAAHHPACIGMFIGSLNAPMTDPQTASTLIHSPKYSTTLIAIPTYRGMRGDPWWISATVIRCFKPGALNSAESNTLRTVVKIMSTQGLQVLNYVPELINSIQQIPVNNPEIVINLFSQEHVDKWLEQRLR